MKAFNIILKSFVMALFVGLYFIPSVQMSSADGGWGFLYTVLFAFHNKRYYFRSGAIFAGIFIGALALALVFFTLSFFVKKKAFGLAFGITAAAMSLLAMGFAFNPFIFRFPDGERYSTFTIYPLGITVLAIFIVAATATLVLAIVNLTRPEPVTEVKEEAGEKKPSKLKLIARATKRVNSRDFVGTLYGFQMQEKGKFLNLADEGGLVMYTATTVDEPLTSDEVVETTFESKSAWYSSGGASDCVDIVIRMNLADGRTGILKAPIARWNKNTGQGPIVLMESLKEALKRLGSPLSFSYRPYPYLAQVKGKGTVSGYFIDQNDEEFLAELKLNYPGGGKILKPDHLTGKEF